MCNMDDIPIQMAAIITLWHVHKGYYLDVYAKQHQDSIKWLVERELITHVGPYSKGSIGEKFNITEGGLLYLRRFQDLQVPKIVVTTSWK